jgi:hypothetical protein
MLGIERKGIDLAACIVDAPLAVDLDHLGRKGFRG